MRGLVMVLMTLDHASHVFHGAALGQDSYLFWANGADLMPTGTPWAFLTRWITHLCAPTFLFLAGISAALAIASRRAKGISGARISAYLPGSYERNQGGAILVGARA